MTSFDRKTFIDALKVVTPASKGAGLPVLSGVRIDCADEVATLTCSNLDETISTTVPCDTADVAAESWVLPAALLARIFAGMKGDVVTLLEVDGGKVKISSGRKHASLPTLPIDDWPKSARPETERITLSVGDVEQIRRIVHAVSRDMFRPSLTGIHLSTSVAESTDSFRLARVDIDADLPDMLVPGVALLNVLAATDGAFNLSTDGNAAMFTDGATSWTTRLIRDKYPDLPRLIRDESKHAVTVNAADFVAALEGMSALGPDNTPTRIDVLDGRLVLQRSIPGVGDMTDEVDATGDVAGMFGVWASYLVDAIEGAGDDEVTVETETPLKPVIVRGSGGYVSLVMPIRIEA